MTTTIQPTDPSQTPAPVTGTGKSILSNAAEQKDMFLKLLVAQLKNQDPTAPMDQKDMMAQMSQMTSVEQMTNMVETLKTMSFNTTVAQSVGLIGKSVDYVTGNEINSTIESSSVTGVAMANGQIKLQLANGNKVDPSSIVRVSA
jgi:flagellar basal-body rod modification protein FlgD